MTTIATDGKSMAGDGFVTGEGVIYSRQARKVFRLDDGRLVGVCGSTYNIEPFLSWLKDGGDKPTMHDGFEALVLSRDGKCLSYNEHCRAIPEDVPSACGSGRSLAIGALEAGCTAKRAVEIAARRDTGTGGKITSLKLGK